MISQTSRLFIRWGHYDRWWRRVSKSRGSQRAGRWLSTRTLPGQLQLHEPQPGQVTKSTHIHTHSFYTYNLIKHMCGEEDYTSLIRSSYLLLFADLAWCTWKHTKGQINTKKLRKFNLLFQQAPAHSHSPKFPSERRSSHWRHDCKPSGEDKSYKQCTEFYSNFFWIS